MFFIIYGFLLQFVGFILDSDVNVLLFGDSLINIPFSRFALSKKIHSLVISQNDSFNFINSGVNGNRIADLKDRVTIEIANNRITPSDFIFVLWDSDASDVDERELSANELKNLRERFVENLIDVLKILVKTTPYLAVGGPIILGEGVSCEERQRKWQSIEYYYSTTKNITNAYNITYLDIRADFLSGIPNDWNSCYGLLTKEGEHPNEKGSSVLAVIFARQMNEWLSHRRKEKKVIHSAYWRRYLRRQWFWFKSILGDGQWSLFH